MQTPFCDASVSKSTITLSYLFPRARSRLYNGKHCMKRDSLLCFVAVYCRKLNILNCKIKWLAWQTSCTLQKLVNKILLCTRKSGTCVKTNSPAEFFILNLKIGAFPVSFSMLFYHTKGSSNETPFAQRLTIFFEAYTPHYGTKNWRKTKHILPALELAPV